MKIEVWSETIELPSGNVIRIEYQDGGSVEVDMPITFEGLEELVKYINARKG